MKILFNEENPKLYLRDLKPGDVFMVLTTSSIFLLLKRAPYSDSEKAYQVIHLDGPHKMEFDSFGSAGGTIKVQLLGNLEVID